MNKENWETVYSEEFGGTWTPNEGLVRFTARYVQRRTGVDIYKQKKKIGKVLDAGCGNGRHIVYFAQQGINVYGVDISEKSIEIAKAWLQKEKLTATLKAGDINNLPFDNDYFDVVVSLEVLDHLSFLKAQEVLQDLKRVLKNRGYLYLTLRSVFDSEYGRGKEVGINTFVLQEGYEKGIIQHYFDLAEIKKLLKGFNIFDLELYEQRFPGTYTLDKAYLQSSKTEKRNIELTKAIDLNLKYSRWHITAEKSEQ